MINKMNKKSIVGSLLFVFVFASFVLILSGCSPSGPGGSTHLDSGTSGVDASFFDNVPPSQIYDSQKLTIPVKVVNKGTFDTTATVYLVGFDKNILQGQNSKTVSLKGVSQSLPIGDIKEITFDLMPHLPNDADHFSPPINLYICYPYETKHTFSVCVSSSPTYTVSKAQCNPNQAYSYSGGQGAPVAVTSISQTPGQGMTTFNIQIANVGGGKVIDPSKVSSCLSTNEMDLNKVKVVSVTMPGVSNMSCSPKEVYLVNGKGQFTCTAHFNTNTNGPQVTALNVILDYGYKKLESSKTINIIKSVR